MRMWWPWRKRIREIHLAHPASGVHVKYTVPVKGLVDSLPFGELAELPSGLVFDEAVQALYVLHRYGLPRFLSRSPRSIAETITNDRAAYLEFRDQVRCYIR